jgi:hypothetical protein
MPANSTATFCHCAIFISLVLIGLISTISVLSTLVYQATTYSPSNEEIEAGVRMLHEGGKSDTDFIWWMVKNNVSPNTYVHYGSFLYDLKRPLFFFGMHRPNLMMWMNIRGFDPKLPPKYFRTSNYSRMTHYRDFLEDCPIDKIAEFAGMGFVLTKEKCSYTGYYDSTTRLRKFIKIGVWNAIDECFTQSNWDKIVSKAIEGVYTDVEARGYMRTSYHQGILDDIAKLWNENGKWNKNENENGTRNEIWSNKLGFFTRIITGLHHPEI